MNPIPLTELRLAIGGKALSTIRPDEQARSVSTDTRTAEPGCVFFALRGDRFDGHAFLADAAARGAVAAVVDREPTVELPNLKFIQVPDTRIALGKLATHVRNQMSKCRVIAVAGSNGKTSTKHLISAALSSRLRGSISPKSFNNDIGVPLTIFPADPVQDYLVLEIGTNHRGEVARLSEMARPDIGVITNCSAEHLAGLGDLLGVRQENASISRGMDKSGLLVVNGDDRDLLDAVRNFAGRVVTFGFGDHNDLYATDVEVHENGTSFRLNNRQTRVFVPMIGRHNAANALAAIAVARRFHLPEEDVIKALATSSKPDMRMQRQQAGAVTLLNDAYNANPASMAAAVATLLDVDTAGRRVAVIGDMRELGDHSERYHRELGRLLASHKDAIDLLVCVGECSKWIVQDAKLAGFPRNRLKRYDDAAKAAEAVPGLIKPGDLVLLKASRGIRLERVAEALTARRLVEPTDRPQSLIA